MTMNYLAHLYLSCTEEELLCGNFLGDLISNKELKLIPEEWMRGIKLPRQIDYFTDNHPEVKACTKLIHKTQGKYSPVVIDVFFDYLLFLNWETYSGLTFEDFELQIYETIQKNITKIPERIKTPVENMIKGKFLRSSISLEGLEFTFIRLKKKMKFKSNVENAIDDFVKHKKQLDRHFNIFFPEAIEMSDTHCKC